jgi:hypothetical protein
MYYLVNRVAAHIKTKLPCWAEALAALHFIPEEPYYPGRSTHSEVGGGFQRRATDAADHSRTITTGQGIGDFAGTGGTVKRVVRL